MTHALKRLRLCALLLLGVFAILPLTAAPTYAGTSCLPASIKRTLAQIRAKFGPVQVVSTHRPGARIAGSGKRSYHASCRAVDFNPPPGKYKQVVAWLRQNHDGGLGTYSCGMHHIHIDNGPHVRFHKCQGSGRYASRSAKSRRYAKRNGSNRYAKAYSGRRYAASGSRRSRRSANRSRSYRAAAAPARRAPARGLAVAQYMQRSLAN